MPLFNSLCQTSQENILCLSSPFWCLQLHPSLWELWTPTPSGKPPMIEFPWLNSPLIGAFHMHWDFFFDIGLCLFIFFFFELCYQEGYFCLPCNFINAGWWKIRREQISMEGSVWIQSGSSFNLFPWSSMRITAILQENFWSRIL